jgi:hypothetical protein
MQIRISHWLPIITFCPVNGGMDFIYVTVTYYMTEGTAFFPELYGVRKELRKTLQGRTLFMEDVAQQVLDTFSQASAVEVALMFRRHVVNLVRK